MPRLDPTLSAHYDKMRGGDWYEKYNDTPEHPHGGTPHRGLDILGLRDLGIPFKHRPEHDVESCVWTLISVLLHVVPKGTPTHEVTNPTNDYTKMFGDVHAHTINSGTKVDETREHTLLVFYNAWQAAFLGPMKSQSLCKLLNIGIQVFPEYAWMATPPRHVDHLHEAVQRLILSYLVANADNDIELDPQLSRDPGMKALEFIAPDVNTDGTRMKRRTASEAINSATRTRSRDSSVVVDDGAAVGRRGLKRRTTTPGAAPRLKHRKIADDGAFPPPPVKPARSQSGASRQGRTGVSVRRTRLRRAAAMQKVPPKMQNTATGVGGDPGDGHIEGSHPSSSKGPPL